MIEAHGDSLRRRATDLSSLLGQVQEADLPTKTDAELCALLEAFTTRLMDRLAAAGAALVWQGDVGGQPRCLASSGMTPLSQALGMLGACRSLDRVSAKATWSWRRLRENAIEWLLIDFPLQDLGRATVLVSFPDGHEQRQRSELLMPDVIVDSAPFLGVCGLLLCAQSKAQRLEDATHSLSAGMMIVDARARVLFANRAAESLCSQGESLRIVSGTVRAGTLHDSLRLQAAIDHVLDRCTQGGHLEPLPVVPLKRDSGRPLMIMVHPLEALGDHEGDAAAVLHLFDPERDLTGAIRPICQFYGLSAVETKLVHWLALGHSLCEAAEQLHLKEQTARSYLKRIFGKTGTNRQGELVALVLQSIVHSVASRDTYVIEKP